MKFNIKSWVKRPLSLLALFGLLLMLPLQVSAEPYLAMKNRLQCSACHVNPIGGGLRNDFGNQYGHQILPQTASDLTAADVGKLSEWLRVGGNFRYNGEASQDDADNKTSTFKVDSAQLYLAVTPKGSPLTFYLDQQIAPGAALNREAFVLYRFDSGHYLKAGKMYVPFGLRLEDDTAYVRQTTGFNFDSSDNGVELGLEYGTASVNLFVSNGTGAVSNNDDRFLYGLKGEKLFADFRLGATAVFNDGKSEERTLLNLYGGYTWRDFTLLGELDYIVNRQAATADQKQRVGLFEINYQWMQGLNLKLTSEYLDPNVDIDEDEETRYSLIAEYAPVSNLQLRGGIRVADSIPQRPQRNYEKFFVQAHLYF